MINLNETTKKIAIWLYLALLLLMSVKSKSLVSNDKSTRESCSSSSIIAKIGTVIDHTSRVGKEEKIAMKMSIQDHINIIFNSSSSLSSTNCVKLDLLIQDSEGNQARATANAIDLIKRKQVQAMVGTFTIEEASLVSELINNQKTNQRTKQKFPFISLTTSPNPSPMPYFFQISNAAVFQARCIASIVNHFNWRKVTAIYEHDSINYGFSARPETTLTLLSDSLKSVNSGIEHHSAFPFLSSHSRDPEKAVETQLRELKRKSNKVFIVFHFSLSSVLMLFEKAKRMGMMEKGYVWIVSDEIASLLDSLDSSFIRENMQGVIGIRTRFVEKSRTFKQFKSRFRRIYGSQYPEEEENSSPSVFALRAYDSVTAIAKALESSRGEISRLSEKLSSIDFKGLSGVIKFKNGMLAQSPTFEIINVDGKSYREIGFWSERRGLFSIDFVEPYNSFRPSKNTSNVGPIFWPGGLVETVPTGLSFAEEDKVLKIAVAARGLFREYVSVTHDQERNKTSVRGFSIDVFEAAVKRLPYQLRYEFVPFYGTYDEMVYQVYNKVYDGAAGEIQIYANRFRFVEFTQAYMNSGLDMIVTAEPDQGKERWIFKKVFSKRMWIFLISMHFFVCTVVWLVERQHLLRPENQPRENNQCNSLGFSLWLSILLFSLREPLKCDGARFVFSPWILVNLLVMATFTASLSSMLTVSKIKPSILDIETLQKTNAMVGCNGNSFIVKYLIDTLNFRPENIRNFSSVSDYPDAFKKGEIKAAFFMSPHAMVFLARYCEDFVRSGPTSKLGGIGFAFPKRSPLAMDFSVALIEVTESKEVEKLENAMLSTLNNCTSSPKLGSGPIGSQPFSVLLIITITVSTFALLIIIVSYLRELLKRRFWRWAITYLKKSSRNYVLPVYLNRQNFD